MTNDCETAIEKTGWGTCHYLILTLCGLCSLAESMAYTIFITSVPILSCDLNILGNDVLALSSISSLGMITGSFLFGTMADLNGRKKHIPITMLIIFSSCIGLSFSLTYFIVCLSVFGLGIGIGGNNVILRVYLVEFLPIGKRTVPLVVVDMAWIVGYFSGFGVSWFFVPSVLRHMRNQFRPSSWRVLVIVGGVPSLLMSCTIGILPSSPRYLLYRRRHGRALTVLQEIYAVNYSRHADTYPETNFDHCIQPDEDDDPNSPRNAIIQIQRFVRKSWQRIREMFQVPFRKYTVLGLAANSFQFPGYVWLALWDTQFLQDQRGINNSTCRLNSSTIEKNFFFDCHRLDENRLELFLIVSIGYVVGLTVLAVFMIWLKKKICLISTGVVGGSLVFLLMFVDINPVNRLAVSIVVLGSYGIIGSVNGVLILENYPTRLRSTVFGLIRIVPHLTSYILQLIHNPILCTTGIVLVSVSLIGGSILGSFLPDLTGKSMRE